MTFAKEMVVLSSFLRPYVYEGMASDVLAYYHGYAKRQAASNTYTSLTRSWPALVDKAQSLGLGKSAT